jgi:Spy/CpxP family protein refolding chaperone
MKKTTLMMIASATMLLAAPAGMMQGQGKGMIQKKQMMKKKMMNSPFLIKHGLPHLTKMVMSHMNDPVFNLTPEQKTKLTEIRKETMGSIMQIKPEVMKLRKEIVQASTSGTSADSLKEKVEKLASLEAKATMVHLRCIEKTKSVLTKDQLLFLLANKNKMKKHGMKKGMGQGKMKSMKCAPGKCGGK